ncbi:MAG TPA: dockerin type I domain-containing protein, partial [Candidatus Nanoarchaeia archaeon]|nr:dockerin type I domain-containing protein [Candidatus Nanoarchaeia archaeon]
MQKRGFLLIIFLILLAVPVYASCLGDFNNNGEVDNEDFGLFQSEYGKAVNEENKAYDLDNDGDIDFADFTLFSKEVGKTCGLAKPASQPINLVGGESEIKISGKLNNAYY